MLDTTAGAITIGFLPDKAPEHVRTFLRLADAGLFDGTAFHRIVRGFVVQTGSLNTRRPSPRSSRSWCARAGAGVQRRAPRQGDRVNGAGDEPASATTSFFIVTADAPSLDGRYAVFGRAIDGLDVVETIEAAPVNGEAPVTPVVLNAVRLTK